MGAGIIFMTENDGKLHFLFGREANIESTYHKDRGKFSDFGGSKEKNETYKETAIRECMEETMGLYMTKKQLNDLIDNNLIVKIEYNNYCAFVVKVKGSPYSGKHKSFLFALRDSFKHAYKNDYEIVSNHNGLYEKDMAKWFNGKLLEKNIDSFRPWYKKFIKFLINFIKKKYKINQVI
jgi:hypothetical protein